MLELRQVCRYFSTPGGQVKAIDGVDLILQPGDWLALYGPSGSGKSTLLSLMGGLDRPTSGDIFLNGQNLATASESQLAELRLKRLGFVFQAYNLLPVLTALENVAFVLELAGVPRQEREDRAQQMLQLVGLSGLEHRRPDSLSGGQQQRVAVARAMVTQPQLILADEPTANLDTQNAQMLIALFAQLNQEAGATFVIASHDPQVIGAAKRQIQLVDGHILHDKTP